MGRDETIAELAGCHLAESPMQPGGVVLARESGREPPLPALDPGVDAVEQLAQGQSAVALEDPDAQRTRPDAPERLAVARGGACLDDPLVLAQPVRQHL